MMATFNEELPIVDQAEGAVSYTVGRTTSDVLIEFSDPVKWIAMSSNGARELATNLRKMAADLDRLNGRIESHPRQRGRRRRRKS